MKKEIKIYIRIPCHMYLEAESFVDIPEGATDEDILAIARKTSGYRDVDWDECIEYDFENFELMSVTVDNREIETSAGWE